MTIVMMVGIFVLLEDDMRIGLVQSIGIPNPLTNIFWISTAMIFCFSQLPTSLRVFAIVSSWSQTALYRAEFDAGDSP